MYHRYAKYESDKHVIMVIEILQKRSNFDILLLGVEVGAALIFYQSSEGGRVGLGAHISPVKVIFS